MDPVTHALMGMSLAKLTGHGISLSDPASVGMIIGSVFPDIDIVLQKWGDYVYLKNHRAITHSVFGLTASAALIAAVLCGLYGSTGFLSIFSWTLAGCFSHTFFDLLNSYGAKLFWPLCNKKFSLSLLTIFDPLMFGILTGYMVTAGRGEPLFLYIFIAYLVSRVLMRLAVDIRLRRKFAPVSKSIDLLPSMTGVLRWHFILEAEDFFLVGEKSVFKKGERLIKKLCKQQLHSLEEVILSPVGRFFQDFTPLFHIACEQADGLTRYIFTDMRYFTRGDFLHHAVLEVDACRSIVRASFHPYSIHRSCDIPVDGPKRRFP